MDYKTVLEIVGSVIASFGGAAAIISIVVRRTSNMIADNLQKKYQLKLDKELETHKTQLGNKQYITQTTFDKEFQIYQDVAAAFFDMVRDISVMIPAGFTTVPADKEERKKDEEEKYKIARKSVIEAQNVLNRNAPFISEEIYNLYNEMRRLASLQLSEFEERWNVLDLRPQEEKEAFSRDAYKRTTEINKKFDEACKAVRTYLKQLEVIK